MKKSSTSLVITEMQRKTTLRFHSTLDRMPSKKQTVSNAGKNEGEKEPSHTVGGNVVKAVTLEMSTM
jgi:hypothetical protein